MDVVIVDTEILSNTASFWGGGVMIASSSFSFDRCTIQNNHSQGDGGAFRIFGSNGTVTHSEIRYNSADGIVGGIR